MDSFKNAMDQIKKIAFVKNSQQLMQSFTDNKQSFSALEKQWFQPSSAPHDLLPPSNDEYLHDIFSYVDLAISMYSSAIAHHSLNKVLLLFSKVWSDGIEPRVCMEFDSSNWTIDIDDLWQSKLKLDRTMKQECINLSEIVWYEYRPTVDIEQLHQDAEQICILLRRKYPTTEISFSLDNDS